MKIVLETPRLRLREMTVNDVAVLTQLDGDPEVMRFLSRRPTTAATVSQQVMPRILEQYRTGELGTWAAVDRDDGAFLGWLELSPVAQQPAAAELGYRLRRSVWGRGLATEGAKALVDHGFNVLGLERITAETMAVNNGSRRVMEKAGLRYVRTIHLDFDDPLPGTEHGEVVYELTHREWTKDRD